jgi:hypothetical protein
VPAAVTRASILGSLNDAPEEAAMTYPPTPGPDGTYPPPPDPPIQAYQPPPQYGQQPYAYGTPPVNEYGYPGSPYSYPNGPYQAAPATDGLAIASLVVSCAAVAGLCLWGIGGVLGIVGAILGHVARRRIRASGAAGSGLALAGIIIGWILTALSVVGAAVLIFFFMTQGSTGA